MRGGDRKRVIANKRPFRNSQSSTGVNTRTYDSMLFFFLRRLRDTLYGMDVLLPFVRDADVFVMLEIPDLVSIKGVKSFFSA